MPGCSHSFGIAAQSRRVTIFAGHLTIVPLRRVTPMRRSLLALSVLILPSLSNPAVSLDVTVGSTPIKLPAPSGMCQIEASQPADARYIEAVEKGLVNLNK